MTTAVTASPTSRASTAPAARSCTVCKKNPLSYNNTTGICSECQERQGGRVRSKRTTGVQQHRGLQLEPQSAPPAKSNGADRHEAAHGNAGARETQNRSPAADTNRTELGTTRIESRVDLLLAAIPKEDKAKMLSAWLAGDL